jgi:hypothetical protein
VKSKLTLLQIRDYEEGCRVDIYIEEVEWFGRLPDNKRLA